MEGNLSLEMSRFLCFWPVLGNFCSPSELLDGIGWKDGSSKNTLVNSTEINQSLAITIRQSTSMYETLAVDNQSRVSPLVLA